MITKTLSGLVFLDEPYGGVYAGRSVLVCGRSGTGKTAVGFHFVQQGLQQDDRCLILSTMQANDLTILGESLGFALTVPVDRGDLILLEYESFVPGRALSWNTIPAEGFNQLREIIERNSVTRVMLDTVLPWVTVASNEHMAEQVFSFVRSCDRLGITTLMTMPKPVSSMAFRLKKAVETVTPVSVLLSPSENGNHCVWQTVKYLGEKNPVGAVPYTIEQGKGVVPLQPGSPTAEQQPDGPRKATPESGGGHKPIRFSSKISPSSRDHSPESGSTFDAAQAKPRPPGPARLANVWKPNADA